MIFKTHSLASQVVGRERAMDAWKKQSEVHAERRKVDTYRTTVRNSDFTNRSNPTVRTRNLDQASEPILRPSNEIIGPAHRMSSPDRETVIAVTQASRNQFWAGRAFQANARAEMFFNR